MVEEIMVITTASKLILANDEVEDLKQIIYNKDNYIDTLKNEIRYLLEENSRLRQFKPWWKFW
jgi:regulator of replication initiation timing